MSIFAGKKSYAGSYTVKSVEPIPQEDKDAIESAHVVESHYGLSVCFIMKAGNIFYIALDPNCNATVGEVVDIEKATVVTLEKLGSSDITRIRI